MDVCPESELWACSQSVEFILILRQWFCDLIQIRLHDLRNSFDFTQTKGKSSEGIFIGVGFEMITHSDFKKYIQTINAGFLDRCPHFRNIISNFTF